MTKGRIYLIISAPQEKMRERYYMNLQEFLNANIVEGREKEIVLNDRFKDEEGKILKFKIRSMNDRGESTDMINVSDEFKRQFR